MQRYGQCFAYIFADELAGVLRSRSVGIAVVEMSGLINILLLLSSFLRASPAFSGLSELCLAVSPDFLDFDINNVLLSV